jgi:hypothetical protein
MLRCGIDFRQFRAESASKFLGGALSSSWRSAAISLFRRLDLKAL